jgi:hypothetical protein
MADDTTTTAAAAAAADHEHEQDEEEDYDNLDLSFDDISSLHAANNTASTTNNMMNDHGQTTTSTSGDNDPTVFTKPNQQLQIEEEEDYILGTLIVRVVAARDLEPAETLGLGHILFGGASSSAGGGQRGGRRGAGGTAHPYALVRFGSTTQRTSTVYDSLCPIWPRNESMYMDVTHPPPPRIASSSGSSSDTTKSSSSSSSSTTTTTTTTVTAAADGPHTHTHHRSYADVAASQQNGDALQPTTILSAVSACQPHTNTTSSSPRRSLAEPILSVAIFHASDQQQLDKYNPRKKKQQQHNQSGDGDSDDRFLGMASVDLTALITGKVTSVDRWLPLGGCGAATRAAVRIVCEYEASDALPHPGDIVVFTHFCHPVDLFPAKVDGYYTVEESGGSGEQQQQGQQQPHDMVLISYTSSVEGWVSTFQCHRNMLLCVERQSSNLQVMLETEMISIAQRLSQSPAATVVQETLSKVPDEGIVSVSVSVVQNATSLLGRWMEHGLGTAMEDIANATNWDGRFNPSAAEQLDEEEATSSYYMQQETTAALAAAQATASALLDDSIVLESAEDLLKSPPNQEALPNMPCCPITQEPMRDPVVAADGHTYERMAILRWLKTSDKSPLTGSMLPHKNLVPNYMLLSSVQEINNKSHSSSSKRVLPIATAEATTIKNGTAPVAMVEEEEDDDELETMEVKID